GWSSPVARQAHNLKAAGSNPAPATKSSLKISNYLLIARGKASLSLAMVAPRPADHNLKGPKDGSNPAPETKFSHRHDQYEKPSIKEGFRAFGAWHAEQPSMQARATPFAELPAKFPAYDGLKKSPPRAGFVRLVTGRG
ncbi:hypothetical protein, partial [Rhizobium leguminosarum]|uniref:hypothetical protein n=1 Tax=Rhizobium leguminosarum TaxID=384 RepID=UPI003F9C6008